MRGKSLPLAVPAPADFAQEAHEGKSADEIAKELANPNNSLASLVFKNQYRWYKGDLPGADDLQWDGVTALGDIGFDLAYGVTEKSGLLWALGMVGTLPTATDSNVAGKQLRLGPEALLAKFEKWGITESSRDINGMSPAGAMDKYFTAATVDPRSDA